MAVGDGRMDILASRMEDDGDDGWDIGNVAVVGGAAFVAVVVVVVGHDVVELDAAAVVVVVVVVDHDGLLDCAGDDKDYDSL